MAINQMYDDVTSYQWKVFGLLIQISYEKI